MNDSWTIGVSRKKKKILNGKIFLTILSRLSSYALPTPPPLTHEWCFAPGFFNFDLYTTAVHSLCGTVQTGTRKVDPAQKFKCTTAARAVHRFDV